MFGDDDSHNDGSIIKPCLQLGVHMLPSKGSLVSPFISDFLVATADSSQLEAGPYVGPVSPRSPAYLASLIS